MEILQKVYLSYLKKASSQLLGPLQLTSFDIITRAIVDTMMSKQIEGTSVTNLSDLFTDIHLECIETGIGGVGARSASKKNKQQFQMEKGAENSEDDDNDDFDDMMYDQTEIQEALVYQFAGLTRRAYKELSKGLGVEFDTSQGIQELRLNNWVSPVYARLQRRFVRFVGGNVEEKLEEIELDAFETMLRNVAISIEPVYPLYNNDNYNDNNHRQGEEEGSISSKDDPNNYPVWKLADFILKILRNSISCIDVESIESKVVRMFQVELSKDMRSLAKALEMIADNDVLELSSKEINTVEKMLNIGHAATAGVYAIWQIRGNIAGTKGEDGQINKEFLKPPNVRIMLDKSEKDILAILPRAIRKDVEGIIKELVEIHQPAPHLLAAAIMAHAARVTAESELRALITYNSDADDWPSSRDDAFVGIFSNILSFAMIDEDFDENIFHENLIAASVLEETLGVREPRDAVTRSYTTALEHAAILTTGQFVSWTRIDLIERSLLMIMRLPEDAGGKIRQRAFKNVISIMMESKTSDDINSYSPQIGEMMGISDEISTSIVTQLYDARFDKTVGKVLMNSQSDILAMPDIGNVFLDEVRRAAAPSMDEKACDERVIYIASAMIQSFLEMALEDDANMMSERASAMLYRCYGLTKNPLISAMHPHAIEENRVKLIQTSSKMSTSRLSKEATMKLVRMLGKTKDRLQGKQVTQSEDEFTDIIFSTANVRIETPGKDDEVYLDFLSSLQEAMIKDYASMSIRGM